MNEQPFGMGRLSEGGDQDQEPQQVTCSGGIKLPSLSLLFGQRAPLSATETGQESDRG